MHQRFGFTLVELLVVVALIAILSVISVKSFSENSRAKQLEVEVDTALSFIKEAQSKAVNSLNGSEFGIRFASTTLTEFEGTSFNQNDIVQVLELSGGVSIQSITLGGGGTDIYFSQLTGRPSKTGVVVFQQQGRASSTKTMTISSTGLIEIQ